MVLIDNKLAEKSDTSQCGIMALCLLFILITFKEFLFSPFLEKISKPKNIFFEGLSNCHVTHFMLEIKTHGLSFVWVAMI